MRSDVAFRKLYGIYEHLADDELVDGSRTSKLLHNPRWHKIRTKLEEEINEMRDSVSGRHGHPFLLEASQVLYWMMLANACAGRSYVETAMHSHAREGYDTKFNGMFELELSSNAGLDRTTHDVLRLVGGFCRQMGYEVEQVPLYEIGGMIAEVGKKPYLFEPLMDAGLL